MVLKGRVVHGSEGSLRGMSKQALVTDFPTEMGQVEESSIHERDKTLMARAKAAQYAVGCGIGRVGCFSREGPESLVAK